MAEFPEFRDRFGPRGVVHSYADGRIEDTGPLTKERMTTIDDEIIEPTQRFIRDAVDNDTPFFVWFNTTGMHFRTHIAEEIRGQAGRWQSEYHDAMVEHDKRIGVMLDYLDEMGLAEDTIVLYSTDNGVHMNTWPDGGMTPFRNEKNSNWEGAFRVPSLVRWPGQIEPGTVFNGIMSHADWFPTLLTAAGAPELKAQLKAGTELADSEYRVHLDGLDQFDYLTGAAEESARNYFFYVSDDGDLTALRYDNWKLVFIEQRAQGTLGVWAEPFTELRVPKIFNLRMDPYERADITSNTYWDWVIDHAFLLVPAQFFVQQLASTLIDFPPRQESASFTVSKALEKLQAGLSSS